MTSDKVSAMRIGLQAIPHLERAFQILDTFKCPPEQLGCNESCPMFPKDKPGMDSCIVVITRWMISHLVELETDVKQKRLVEDE